MMQVGKYMRRATDRYMHWCPGCEEMHGIRDGVWTFNGDLEKPTFSPSVHIHGLKRNMVDGKWVGEGKDAWLYDAKGNPIPEICHYFLRNGTLEYCHDSTHALAGKTVPLPELPEGYRDQS